MPGTFDELEAEYGAVQPSDGDWVVPAGSPLARTALVVFDDVPWAADVLRASAAARVVAEDARASFEQEVAIEQLKACSPEGLDGTGLPHCVRRWMRKLFVCSCRIREPIGWPQDAAGCPIDDNGGGAGCSHENIWLALPIVWSDDQSMATGEHQYAGLARREARHDAAVIHAEVRRLALALAPFGVLYKDALRAQAGGQRWRQGSFEQALRCAVRTGVVDQLPGGFYREAPFSRGGRPAENAPEAR